MSLEAFLIVRVEFTCMCSRYDFFYKNGVPKWRGTGYYYSRFRPGLGVSPILGFPVQLLKLSPSPSLFS